MLPHIYNDGPPAQKNQEQVPLSIMGREVNIDSIRALEERIEEGDGDLIRLKRARNSLLNISTRMPPEILGHIFVWRAFRERNRLLNSVSYSYGLGKGSYNFLLVCHHWFEVASHTPELWDFWGDTLQQWQNRHRYHGNAPLDLVLDEWGGNSKAVFGGPLQDALKDRAIRDKIREVHITHCDPKLLTSIISSLTPDGEGVREKRIESITLRQKVDTVIITGLLDFFAQATLPKLQYLDISGFFQIPSWDHLPSLTTRLTTLSLKLEQSALAQTTSSLISILTSNPNLRELALSNAVLPEDIDGSAFRVPLRHLRAISLEGEFPRVSGLLCQLELPAALDSVRLDVHRCTVEGISQTLGPYMQDLFRRDIRFQDRLEILVSLPPGCVGISVGVLSDHYYYTFCPRIRLPSASFKMFLTGPPPSGQALEKLRLDLMAFTPQDHAVSFKAEHRLTAPEELFVAMPNIKMLWLYDVNFSNRLLQPNPEGPHSNKRLLPSLRSLHLENVGPDEIDWDLLKAYLVHQASEGEPISLQVTGRNECVPLEVQNEIENLVEEFTYYEVCGCGCSVNEVEEGSEDDEDEGDEDYEGEEDEDGW